MLKIIKIFEINLNLILIIKKLWNIDVTDYKHIIDQDGLNHVYKRHGINSKEKTENVITLDDLTLIEKIINEADEIVGGGLSGKRKLPTVMYIKTIEIYKYYYIEEILKGKKELRIKTLYKNIIRK